jgi:predicted nucleotidyltransferase
MTKTKEKDLDSIAQWAAGNARIRRVWLFGNGSRHDHRDKGRIEVAVELEPVFDSEETLTIWIANAGSWQSQLRQRLSAPVGLEWFDPDGGTALDEAKQLVYERADY